MFMELKWKRNIEDVSDIDEEKKSESLIRTDVIIVERFLKSKVFFF